MNDDAKPVSFHYFRQHEDDQLFGHGSFMVVVSDEALIALNREHPARWLTSRFNGAATPAERIQALADAVRELDAAGEVADRTEPTIIGRAFRIARNAPHLSTFFAGMFVGGLGSVTLLAVWLIAR